MDLFDLLTPQTTLLTPNRRLSKALLGKHHQWQMAQGKTCWQSLDILPFTTWLQRFWQEYTLKQIEATPLLLTPSQEQLLWEDILRNSPESDFLLQIASTAELAKSAWGTLKQWRVALHNPDLCTTEDGEIFQRWAQTFQALCDKNAWIDSQSVTDIIIEKIKAGEMKAPEQIILVGFTEISPQYQYLLEMCKQQGARIEHYEPAFADNPIYRVALTDEETEIRTMARWAKQRYTQNPKQFIGCIVPQLEKMREKIIHIFSQVFSETGTYNLDYTTLPFNISAGKALTAYPVIHTALQLLKLRVDNIPIDTLSSILRSPFIGDAEREMLSRMQFENSLKRANTHSISISKLLSGKLNLTKYCPLLAERLTKYAEACANRPKTLAISDWVTFFMDHLNLLGWPGERSLNSPEYQVVKRWLELLKEYATFSGVLEPLSYGRALDYLTRLAMKTVFQPESPEAPIQILGMLEATELPFDALWVMGLDDAAWPPSPKPNPFIPQRLQKTLHMPHATAERELIYCERLTTQLKRSAQHVIFSHALKSDDAELRPSPIITNISEVAVDKITLAAFTSPTKQIYAFRDIETVEDELAPALTPTDEIRGGSNIFKLQAACPFKAFAEIRLHAKKTEPPTIGLRALDRGNIMHKALELIWKDIKDKSQLDRMDEVALTELIKTHVEQAILLVSGETIDSLRYLTLESRRLQKIIMEWLALEKQRPEFKVIASELTRQFTLANIPITLRIDRIDELENGKQLIIDYKTGKENHVKAWFGERMDEPQLPLYCVSDPDNIVGIMFAQINPEKMEIKGVSKNTVEIGAVKPLEEINLREAESWEQQIDVWRTHLEKLGHDFYNGDAKVNPKDTLETCNRCDLQPLCRVHEVGL